MGAGRSQQYFTAACAEAAHSQHVPDGARRLHPALAYRSFRGPHPGVKVPQGVRDIIVANGDSRADVVFRVADDLAG